MPLRDCILSACHSVFNIKMVVHDEVRSAIDLTILTGYIYMNSYNNVVSRFDFKQISRRQNISCAEFSAFWKLRCKDEIAVKPVDQGGAVVIWRAGLLMEETMQKKNISIQVNKFTAVSQHSIATTKSHVTV